MPRPARNLCQCRAYAPLKCDWPKDDGTICGKPVCRSCARPDGPDKDYCPFHRGDPPLTQAQQDAAGKAEAEKLAKMFGL